MYQISLIIPVYNVEPYLRACLDSVISQNFENFEVILVDDGSTDGSGGICDEYASRNERFQVIHQKNQGLSAARNSGTAVATGEYISYLDSDDIIHPEYLQCLYAAAIRYGSRVSVCGLTNIPEDTVTFPEVKNNDTTFSITGRDATKIFVVEHQQFMIVATQKLYHRSLIPQLVYPVGKTNEDEFVTYKVLYETEKVAISVCPFYGYRIRRGSIMHKPAPRLDALEALKGAISYFEEKQDEELAAAARRRYLLNIQLAWYRTEESTKDPQILDRLDREHKQFYHENKHRIGHLNFMEACQLHVFNVSKPLYKQICRTVAKASK